ncbi:uncharacterized protein [Panulirus ornatus]|uniref:uncharacterized protein isoform X3 n=1 Tax=Panulirus ornatus TaxID=150431 RepID=UPI003A86C1CF
MYTGAETSKETQHITPHIAAHKSSLASTSSVSTLSSVALSVSGGAQDLAQPHLSHKSGLSAHIPTYRVGLHAPHHSVVKGLDHDVPSLAARHHIHASHSTQLSKSAPQDLSAHATAAAGKTLPQELTPHTSTHHKPLPHIHTVVSQGMNHSPIGTLIPAHQADRGSPYFRVPDSVISVQGPSAVLVSTVGEGIASTHPTSQTTTLVHAQSTLPVQSTATNLTTMPTTSLAANVSLPGGVNPAVATTLSQTNMLTELLMMNIQVNASLQAMNKSTVPPETGSGQVVVLQPAAVDETNSLQPQLQTPKRRRPKMSEDAQVERRTRIALRMREKRAGESEEQKRLRRIREAERMRRKRATEDEIQKLRRRQEAAARARNRRASMSPEERIIDRQKAADRMRLRRATESDEAKAIRRLKAAERMRKRRASETPEQRAMRRQNIALRMKVRRKRKIEEDLEDIQPSEIITRNMASKALKSENNRNNAVHQGNSGTVTNMNSNQSSNISNSQLVTPTSHILVPSSIGVGASIAVPVLEVDPTLPAISLGNSSGLSTVDMTQLSQPLSLHKSVSTTQEQERRLPLSLHKHVAVSQESSPSATSAPVATLLSSMNTSSHSHMEPIPLHKTTNYHHHLPHLLHYHQHHTSSQHHHQHHHQHLQQRHPHQ